MAENLALQPEGEDAPTNKMWKVPAVGPRAVMHATVNI